jgi:hypothetical protein
MKTGHEQSYVGYRGIFSYVRLCAFAEIILFDLFRLFSLDVRQEHEAGEKHLGRGQHVCEASCDLDCTAEGESAGVNVEGCGCV